MGKGIVYRVVKAGVLELEIWALILALLLTS